VTSAARPGWMRLILRRIAALVLCAWLAGLVFAAVQLNAWGNELVRTLLQIRADSVFRFRMAEGREPIPREWYRSRTLALLAASEKLQDDTGWTLFVPGSWRPLDDLRPRVAARIERAFSDIAVETVRRELYFRASQVTGVPQNSHTAELLPNGDCEPARAAAAPDVSISPQAKPKEPAEVVLVQHHLAELEKLDRAVQAMLALQSHGTADAENLRLLVRYTLGVELPGRLSRSAAFFRTGLKPEDVTFAAAGVPRLQQAARCSMAKAMRTLDARLFARNDLLEAESFLAQRAPRLLASDARPGPYAETVDGYRKLVAALNEQEALLATGEYAWLHEASGSLGPTHDRLLARISRISLLGPPAEEQVRRQSSAAVQRFRRQFSLVFGASSEPALVWQQAQGRLVLSPQRVALRDALAALLQEPFMAAPADRAIPAAAHAPLSWDLQQLERALAPAQARRRFLSDDLPRFPPGVRPVIARFVEAHLAQLVQDAAVEAMRPAGAVAFDAMAYRAQREQLAKVQALLVELGARSKAEKLSSLLSRDLVDRLALAEEAIWRLPIYSPRMQDFGWWQGEGSPILQALGAHDSLGLRYSLSQLLSQLDGLGREAAALLAYADASAAASPTGSRWQGMTGELRRYRAGAANSSLLQLERYLMVVGPELNRSNCLERLLAAAPSGTPADEFAHRHIQLHNALISRCAELRFGAKVTNQAQTGIRVG
jgi:type VI secretion system protein ImpL